MPERLYLVLSLVLLGTEKCLLTTGLASTTEDKDNRKSEQLPRTDFVDYT